jgi:repressor LexA
MSKFRRAEPLTTRRPLTERQLAILDYIRSQLTACGRPPTVREICKAFGIASPRGVSDHLLALETKGYIRRARLKSRGIELCDPPGGLRIVGDVAAGQPILAIENVTGNLDLDSAFGRGELFAVRVKGESMLQCGILNGDYVVVRRQPEVPNGAVAVAYLNGEATVKHIYKTRTGYRLQPANDAYEPIEVTAPERADEPPPDFRIAGPVVGVVRTIRP